MDRADTPAGPGAWLASRLVTQHALTTLQTMHEVAKRLIPQIVPWITTGVVAKGKILQAGVTQARSLVPTRREKVEFGLP